MAPLILSNTAERGFAHVAERHSPQAGALPSPLVESTTIPTPVMIEKRDNSPNATGVPVVNPPPDSVKALAGIIVFLGIVVISTSQAAFERLSEPFLIWLVTFTVVAGWKLRAWLRRRKAAKNPASDCESPLPEKIMSEKRNSLNKRTIIDIPYGSIQPLTKARLLPPTPPVFNPEVSWAPQVRSVNGDPFASPYDAGARALRHGLASSVAKSASTDVVNIQAPKPTARRESRLSKISMMVRPSKSRPASLSTIALPVSASSSSSSLADRPPTPKISKKKSVRPLPPLRPKLPGSSIPPVPAINISEPSPYTNSISSTRTAHGRRDSEDERPIVSPRRIDSFYGGAERGRVSIFTRQSTASQHSRNLSVPSIPSIPPIPSDQRASTAGTSSTLSTPKKLPRLVNVVHIFTPAMEDELPIKIGEVLRLNQEFKDGWCAVQRVGKVDAEEGVVPQFCLQDRQDFLPTAKNTFSIRASRSHFSSLSSFTLGSPAR